MGPVDSPFGGGAGRRVSVASGSTLSGAPLFSAPFGTSTQANTQTRDASPSSEVPPAFNNSPFGAPISNEDHHDEPPIPSYALGRRTSVSAESLVPANHRTFPPSGNLESTLEEDEDNTPNPNNNAMPIFPKTEAQLARIRAAIKPNFLFRNLDDDQESDVLAAMKEVTLPSGEMIIEQGAAGDYFYVVESGKLEVFVKREGQVLDSEKGDKPALGKKVATCVEGNSFGELALMHK